MEDASVKAHHLPATALLALAIVCSCIAEPAAGATITIDRSGVNSGDVVLTRDVVHDLSPLPGQTYVDMASIAAAAPVTLAPGDTLDVRVILSEPLRFAVDPSVASVVPLFGAGTIRFALKLQSSATSANVHNTGFAAPTLSLLSPDNATLPSPGGDSAASSFVSDATSGQVLSLTAGVAVLGTHLFIDPARPSFFSGFEANLVVPADMPPTTFDSGATLSISAWLRAVDPPPPLLSIVPEPACSSCWLLGIACIKLGARWRKE
jgi:hypothetical protein